MALRDFSTDYPAAKAWLAARREQPLPEVLRGSARALAEELRVLKGEALRDRLELLRNNAHPLLVENLDTARSAGLDTVQATLCGSSEAPEAVAAIDATAALGLDDAWIRNVILLMLDPGRPVRVRCSAAAAVGRHGFEWAIQPVAALLTNGLGVAGDASLEVQITASRALGRIGSPLA